MNETIERLQIGVATNSIGHYKGTKIAQLLPKLYRRYFIKTKTPHSHQRSNDNQSQNREKQQHNRFRDQQPTRYRSQDHSRQGSGEKESGLPLLVNETGWIFFHHDNIRRVHLPPKILVRLCKRCTIIAHEFPKGTNYTQ